MNRMQRTISALALAVAALTATGGGIAVWDGDDHAVVADRWCC